MFIDKISLLEVRKTPPQDDGCVYPPYIVNINGSDVAFLYDGKNFFAEANNSKTNEELQEYADLAKKMEEEWKTEEEIKEAIAGKGTQYVDRVLYIIESEGLYDKISKAIQSIS